MSLPVLIVDDNAVNRFALQALLSNLGFETHLAESAQGALDAVRTRRFAAVLLDLMMPNVDGYEGAKLLRAAGLESPIIAVTALDDSPIVRARCAEAGIDDVLTKPIDSRALAEKLSRHVAALTPSPVPVLLRDIYGEKDLPTILAAFVEVTHALMGHLERALRSHHSGEAQRTIHELKSASSQLYAGEVTELCRQIEVARVQSDWPKMAALYEALTKALDGVVGVLTHRAP